MTRALAILRRRPVLVALVTTLLALAGVALPQEHVDMLVQLLLILLGGDAVG